MSNFEFRHLKTTSSDDKLTSDHINFIICFEKIIKKTDFSYTASVIPFFPINSSWMEPKLSFKHHSSF